MTKQKSSTLDESQVPEMQTFKEAEKRLREFQTKHEKLISEYRKIAEDHEAAIGAVDKVLRPLFVSCGQFQLTRVDTKYDADALLEAVGPIDFGRYGGYVETVQRNNIDKETLEAFIATGKIPENIVKCIRKQTAFYKKPKEVKP